jgi:hypothetical protein
VHPLIKAELENLERKFGSKPMLTLDDYAELYGVSRQNAGRNLKNRGIPAIKAGKNVYISITELATYLAKKKSDQLLTLAPVAPSDMKSRRGINQLANRKQLGK